MRDEEEKDGFLARWSRRKDAVRRGELPAEPDSVEERPADEAPLAHDAAGKADGEAGAATGVASEPRAEQAGAARPELTEADFADVDFSALNESSDFTRFLGPRVPDAIRQKALARLWQTDPAFSTADVLHDYAEDFTDAAKAVPGIASSWRFGRGYLSDEEVAAWEALGKPPAEAEATAKKSEVVGAPVEDDLAADPPVGAETVAMANGESTSVSASPAAPDERAETATPQRRAGSLADRPCHPTAAEPMPQPQNPKPRSESA